MRVSAPRRLRGPSPLHPRAVEGLGLVEHARSRRLDVPHKGMAERASVLVPLADIAPELIHPLNGLTILEMLRDVDTSGVEPYSPLSI